MIISAEVIAVTGHRPDKIGGYDFQAPQRMWIRDQLRERLLIYRPKRCISGMALGVDQDFANVCIELGIPFTAAIPFVGQEDSWPKESQDIYTSILAKADDVMVVSPGGYAVWKMQVRNKWMVDHCNLLIAVWDGSPGGTGNCHKYAVERRHVIDRINPNHFRG
jgi:uncharacterized phage-like protein YoqJ